VRFPNRLLTKIDIDPAAVDAMVPGMILQPLVENSVKYAVAATPDPVTVTIKARREGGQLVITVSDNGPGGVGERRPKADGCGIGLANVRDRLRARYGKAGTLRYGEQPGGGFETVMRMPLELGRV
jgi:LytS/YehU family sensor histidine kinase